MHSLAHSVSQSLGVCVVPGTKSISRLKEIETDNERFIAPNCRTIVASVTSVQNPFAGKTPAGACRLCARIWVNRAGCMLLRTRYGKRIVIHSDTFELLHLFSTIGRPTIAGDAGSLNVVLRNNNCAGERGHEIPAIMEALTHVRPTCYIQAHTRATRMLSVASRFRSWSLLCALCTIRSLDAHHSGNSGDPFSPLG